MEEKELEDVEIKQDKHEVNHLSYKQYVLIILLTLIMVLGTLFLSFSVVRLLSTSRNMNYNSIIAKLPPIPGDDPGQTDSFIFNYKEMDFIGNGIYIENMFPTTDETGRAFTGEHYTFDFKLLVGKNAIDHEYEVTAVRQDISTLNPRYVKIYLESNGEPCSSVFGDNNRVKVFSEYENATVDITNENEKIIYEGKVSNRDISMGSIDFTLKMWLAEDTPMNNENSGKTFAVKINIYVK